VVLNYTQDVFRAWYKHRGNFILYILILQVLTALRRFLSVG